MGIVAAEAWTDVSSAGATKVGTKLTALVQAVAAISSRNGSLCASNSGIHGHDSVIQAVVPEPWV